MLGNKWYLWVWFVAFAIGILIIGNTSRKLAEVSPRYRRIRWLVFFPVCWLLGVVLLVVTMMSVGG